MLVNANQPIYLRYIRPAPEALRAWRQHETKSKDHFGKFDDFLVV